jgi:hypothetical protein
MREQPPRTNQGNQTTPAELRASDALRLRWLSWQGPNRTLKSVLADLGWANAGRNPKWASQGNIPEEWRYRIERQIENNEQRAAS